MICSCSVTDCVCEVLAAGLVCGESRSWKLYHRRPRCQCIGNTTVVQYRVLYVVAAWKQEGPGFDSDLGVSFVKLHVLPIWVLLTYAGRPQSKNMRGG